MTTRPKATTNDLFITTLHELHSEAPAELLGSLRAQLRQIKSTNPNCAQTAEACLEGLASDQSSLLHVLTAAYLINGGVMIKHQAGLSEAAEWDDSDSDPSPEFKDSKLDPPKVDISTDFESLEEELNRFSISMDGSLKSRPAPLASQSPPPRPAQSPEPARDPLARS